MKIVQEHEKCIGCGACAGVCPDFWEMGDDGKSSLIGSKISSESGNYELEAAEINCNQDAADSCPMSIIHIVK